MDNSAVKTQFKQILTAAKERRGDLSVDTMIVSSHLAQMRTFMLRRGIEFFAEQDSFGTRKEFIARIRRQYARNEVREHCRLLPSVTVLVSSTSDPQAIATRSCTSRKTATVLIGTSQVNLRVLSLYIASM